MKLITEDDMKNTKKPTAIMLVGKARVGKDTFADIAKTINPSLKSYSFAANLKHICAIITGEPLDAFNTRKAEFNDAWGMTHREILQIVGTDCLRDHFNKEVWVKSLVQTISKETNFESDIVITDCRFPNELNSMVGKYNVATVKILREDLGGEVVAGVQGHKSENMEIDTDYTIINDGSLEDYEIAVKNVLEKIYND
jgi:hypothetical protein